jgi:hypothetical protein
MPSDAPQLRTPGAIAAEVGAPLSSVLYLLRKLEIKPIGRAGILRLYDHEAVETVRRALLERQDPSRRSTPEEVPAA